MLIIILALQIVTLMVVLLKDKEKTEIDYLIESEDWDDDL